MPSVLQYSRALIERPPPAPLPGIEVRAFSGEADSAIWLALRERAFARQPVGIRAWDRDDFQRELLAKPWWRPDWMWLAEAETPTGQRQVVGSVTLALRGSGPKARSAVHWLLVLPGWRRRGVGRLLMSYLEAAAWDAGYREVCLETHTAWTAAVRFYETLGYERDSGF